MRAFHATTLLTALLALASASEASKLIRATKQLEEQIDYRVYTRLIGAEGEALRPDVESIIRSAWRPFLPTTVFIGDWSSYETATASAVVVSTQLGRQNDNVIAVDWSGVPQPLSLQAVGVAVGELIAVLHGHFNAPLDKFYVVGHGLGAQVAGVVGHEIQRRFAGVQLPHITALDPLLQQAPSNQSGLLAPTAAQFVEVIHTSVALAPSGHVDYYPNGGQVQPGCSSSICAHSRVYRMLPEMWSNNNQFVAAQCASVAQMSGQRCFWNDEVRMGQSQTARGVYYLDTNRAAPYAKGVYFRSFL